MKQRHGGMRREAVSSRVQEQRARGHRAAERQRITLLPAVRSSCTLTSGFPTFKDIQSILNPSSDSRHDLTARASTERNPEHRRRWRSRPGGGLCHGPFGKQNILLPNTTGREQPGNSRSNTERTLRTVADNRVTPSRPDTSQSVRPRRRTSPASLFLLCARVAVGLAALRSVRGRRRRGDTRRIPSAR